MPEEKPVRVELWADVVCPFCWIGKHHLEDAIRRLGVEDDVEIVHKAFQLNPGATESRPLQEYLAERFGGPERVREMHARVEQMGAPAGLEFDFEHAVFAPTRDAHRLVQFAQDKGRGDAMAERLMRAHFNERADLADAGTLKRLAADVGLAEGDVDALLASNDYNDQVLTDAAEAHALGAQGVPFVVIDRKYGVAGAQPVDVFVDALERARADRAGAASGEDAAAGDAPAA